MKPTFFLSSLLALSLTATAADTALLAIPGAIIYESKLDAAPAAPWKVAKGKWELVEGVVRGSEIAEDKHGAVTRLPNKLQDFVIEYEFKFENFLTHQHPHGHVHLVACWFRSDLLSKTDNPWLYTYKDAKFKVLVISEVPGLKIVAKK